MTETKPGPRPRDLERASDHMLNRKRPIVAMHQRVQRSRDKRRLLGLLVWGGRA